MGKFLGDVILPANNNQDENVAEVKLIKNGNKVTYDIEKIKQHRTVRSNYLSTVLQPAGVACQIAEGPEFICYIPKTSKELQWLSGQTIEANRLQPYRNNAQSELANWIRFSSKNSAEHADGLTIAGMEIEGMPGWLLRNFYGKENVMKKSFREQSMDKVVTQVSQCAGWLFITSKDSLVNTLLVTGKRMHRLF